MFEPTCGVRFYIDSGAGQCMCSCVDAFSDLRSCAIVVVGVAGSLPIHGLGTASFLALDSSGNERIIRIHNCLLCQTTEESDNFNLISVSQLLKTVVSSVTFSVLESSITINQGKKRRPMTFTLTPDDGLYAIDMVPLNASDPRHGQLKSIDLTVKDPMELGKGMTMPEGRNTTIKPASKLGIWHVKVLWIGKIISLAGKMKGFDEGLKDFCADFIAPMSIPPARKTYQTNNVEDLADLSIRFLGVGSERLKQTMNRSIGLSPMIKVDGRMRHYKPTPVPVHNFPQGRWKTGKTPKVDKGIIHNLQQASIGEVVYMDSFEVDDSSHRYAQAFVDYRSNYGDIIPMTSRSQAGWSFTEFCARNFTPLILIRDNIGENIGGQLLKECLHRSVKSAFICPYRKQQNYAEGYLGRVTALASYGMVYSGAPMFMWVWCISCAVFINNITAAFYSSENLWATPYEVVHNEPFMDSSIVVPFGCGVLVLLTEAEMGKFQSRCALMIFVHYANQHPLYTYAVYSPRTKRVLYRQDCIFLTNLFPMRSVRSKESLSIDGDVIIPYRSPEAVRGGSDLDLSFRDWSEQQPLPQYQDHVTGFNLSQPRMTRKTTAPKPTDYPYVQPNNPSFGPPSVVKVPYQPLPAPLFNTNGEATGEKLDPLGESPDKIVHAQQQLDPTFDINANGEAVGEMSTLQDGPEQQDGRDERVSKRPVRSKKSVKAPQAPGDLGKRIPVESRWFYESVLDPDLVPSVPVMASLSTESRPNCVLSFETGNCQTKIEKTVHEEGFLDDKDIPPSELGPFVPVSLHDIQRDGGDEWAAWYLQGVLFYDDELEWCRITGWGAECGIIILHYSSVNVYDESQEEHHVSVPEMLFLIQHSPKPPVIPDYQPSRVLRRSEAMRKVLCYRPRDHNIIRKGSCDGGTYTVRQLGARLGSYDGNLLSTSIIKRILRAQETMFKYGTMIPKNDAEADRSPESNRWISGRTLEWIRLNQASTFEPQWTWKKVQEQYPNYLKSDIGHMFFIYDYKYSGEHRVRLVFDGSRQSPATYNVTYAPTVRAESVRLFHIYAVEYAWAIQQYDVPQAFLRSNADCDIFAYPPKGFAEFPGQLLKLSKMLYGSKQAAALWYNLLHTFLLEIGFLASPLDPCFYRRPVSIAGKSDHGNHSAHSDAILILHVDDMRVAASPSVLASIHQLLFNKFEITISDSGRFLGMDTSYDLNAGILRMQMTTYITDIAERFLKFDLSQGIPYRELVGSLMWVVLCIMGPELLRVKDLARRSNNFTLQDYEDAIQVLHRVIARKDCGIIYRRGAAGTETVPSSTRLGGGSRDGLAVELVEDTSVKSKTSMLVGTIEKGYSTGDGTQLNELQENDLYKLHPDGNDNILDIIKTMPLTNPRFSLVAYSDASFAVGDLKQSVTGFLVMINGTPLLWGSLKQTIVVDSTCSAEYVASSVCCKQILQAENMMQFLDFVCPKPYTMYTDSQACLQIATNGSKLGKVRHIGIRFHLVRCMVISGEIKLCYCITEDMIADIFTKIVAGSQDKRLAVRFYNDCDELILEHIQGGLREENAYDESGNQQFSRHHDNYEAAVAIQPR